MKENTVEHVGQRHSNPIFFKKNADMDFYLLWLLSYQSEKGAEPGECFYAALQIDEKRPDSWVLAWSDLAGRTRQRAETALAKGHRVSAREAFLRAFTYYRGAAFYLRPRDPRFRNTWQAFEDCFQQAVRLFDPPIEPVAIPFEGRTLPGYFLMPQRDGKKRPTLIMVGGGESYREDLYFWEGAAGGRRGYNVLMVDLPGQGATPFDGFAFRADTEEPVRVIVDFLLDYPEVDAERIAIHGLSGGGYFVTRAVAFEHRIRACIANSPITNLYCLVTAEMPAFLQKLPAFASDVMTRVAGRQDPALMITLEKVCWQAGVDHLSGFVELAKECTLDGLIERIQCPTLCLAGDSEGDAGEVSKQLCQFYEALSVSQKSKVVFNAADGANAHCQVGNFSLSHQAAYDWLDEVMK